MSEKIYICKICTRECIAKGFSTHLRFKHQLTFDQYRQKFVEEFETTQCEICGKLIFGSGKTCSHKCNGIRNGRLTALNGRMLGKNNIMSIPGVATQASISRLKNWKIRKNPRIGTHHSAATKQKISKANTGRLLGDKNPMFGKKHTPESIRKIFTHRPMNKLEKEFSEFLIEHNLEYQFQFFIRGEKICKSYDFKIKNYPVIIEIDGDYWHGGPGLIKYHEHINETKENDLFKDELAKKHGFRLLRFWESEFKTNKEKILKILEDNIY